MAEAAAAKEAAEAEKKRIALRELEIAAQKQAEVCELPFLLCV